MPLLSGKLNQTITYWAYGGLDSAGIEVYASPITISGRWEDIHEVFVARGGNERQSRAVVFVDQDLLVDSFLLLGVSTEEDPTDIPLALRIEAAEKIPSLFGGQYVRRVLL